MKFGSFRCPSPENIGSQNDAAKFVGQTLFCVWKLTECLWLAAGMFEHVNYTVWSRFHNQSKVSKSGATVDQIRNIFMLTPMADHEHCTLLHFLAISHISRYLRLQGFGESQAKVKKLNSNC